MAASIREAPGVKILQIPKKGKGLFADKDFKEGDTLFSEEPLVCTQFLWNAYYKYTACDYCMKSLETAEEMYRRLASLPSASLPHYECCDRKCHEGEHVTCPHCQILYCSARCRDQAWSQHHQTLCLGASRDDPDHPLNKLQETWRNMHFPPETASIMILVRMIAMVKQTSNKEAILSAFSEFCHRTVNEEEAIAHKLLGTEFQEQVEILRNLFTESLYDEELSQWFTPTGFRSLFALLGTNGQGIGTSALSVWVKNCDQLNLPESERAELDKFIDKVYEDMDKESGMFLNCEGSGLYALQSTCNHSCVPNAEVTFPHNNHVLEMIATQDIKAGQEICICYLDECQRDRSRHSRQKVLRDNYLFTCSCVKCEEQVNDPDVSSAEDDSDEEGSDMEMDS
ncbi:histone-lysine N-trimethyltransferase SMYD5-like [Lineus longissimus]|uniref:histone-lysine N-trimethyltransferase SMYD5-like n=1 Tax=Lineus longissimus TaxID=88925 RepID=UPI002B4EED4F